VNKRPDKVAREDNEPLCTFWVHAKMSDSISTLSVATTASKTFSLPIPKERTVNWFSDTLNEIIADVLLSRNRDATEENRDLLNELKTEIDSFVEAIWSLYADLPFHNFEKSFHVAFALSKALDQVKHDISPVERFAVMLASLIYEVDHPGLDNENLSKRGGAFPEGKSSTQLHAFELSWTIFSDQKYNRLRSVLCQNTEDFTHFSQLTKSCVVATDIMNPILSAARKKRWEQAIVRSEGRSRSETLEKEGQRKTKTILEHLMIASYLTYTTQTWSFYTEWSGRHYQEMFFAFADGKLSADPADSWYDTELMLFDNIVLPLLQTLCESGPCSALGAELLDRAYNNRNQWKNMGKGLVVDMQLESSGEKRVHFA
jgi:3'5'-cyclic nucleotide phosphodiesterase